MREIEAKMIRDIMDSEQVGYGYVYPMDGSGRKEYYLSTKPEHLADFIAKMGAEAEKILITDIADRLQVSTSMYFLDRCPNESFRQELLHYLLPMQMEEKEPGTLLAVDRSVADEYFALEEQGAAMAEYGPEMGM